MITPPVRFSAPLSLRQLPEGFIEQLKPGQVITAKIETIEGRLLSLFIGKEKIEALLSEQVPLHLLKPGQEIKLKVTSLGPPLVLSLLFEKAPVKENFLPVLGRLLQGLRKKISDDEHLPLPKEKILESLFLNLIKKHGNDDKGLQKLSHQEIRDFLINHWQEGQFLIPFIVGDQVSWGYLTEEEDTPKRKKERVFVLVIFLSRLGLMEARFWKHQGGINIELSFAREEAFKEAQKALSSLSKMFSGFEKQVIIKNNRLSAPPGQILRLDV
ncbi:hypothetical protein Thein_0195 [Thermodesulfatator indicus DSM 15286]|uniref:Uncharacterized protein n=1 Tax=Thermodesulfatator indicus (strain DSM 15286 / JCM 11887 / CIR29812) TaxID=667014 RepID=F8A9D9_THEID|nr:hypothetical protein [Thermodesulfatator indicus]AEH44080.1 hypothetical protein Thein_0195 [Thermodesulfatator indicus DSM 15286]